MLTMWYCRYALILYGTYFAPYARLPRHFSTLGLAGLSLASGGQIRVQVCLVQVGVKLTFLRSKGKQAYGFLRAKDTTQRIAKCKKEVYPLDALTARLTA